MKTLVYVLGYLNMLPSTLVVYLFYILPLTLAKQLKHMLSMSPMPCKEIVHWYVVVKYSWLYKRFQYGGFAAGPFVVLRSDLSEKNKPIVMKHEATHVIQGYIFGTLIPTIYTVVLLASWFDSWSIPWWPVVLLWITTQPVLYILMSAFIWMFVVKEHSYYDNPFEVWARKRSGLVDWDVPPEKWRDGPNDRWLFW